MSKSEELLSEAQSLLNDFRYGDAESHAEDVLEDERATTEQADRARAIVRTCNQARGYSDMD